MTNDQRQCATCAAPLTTRSQRKYCSHPCAMAARVTRPLRAVECSCGETFSTTDPVQRYCSDACRRRFNSWKTGAFRFMPRQTDKVWRY